MRDGKLKKSLKFSMLDGVFASVMQGFTENYITPFALAMKATVSQIGILNSLPNLFSGLFQLKSADITERLGYRKKIIRISVFFHAFILLPIMLAPFVNPFYRIWALIFFIVLYAIFGTFANPAWQSLMSEHIPSDKRGRYFGWRNKRLGFIVIGSSFLAGWILHLFDKKVFLGFTIIFSVATLSRFISWYFLNKMFEPPRIKNVDSYFSFLEFIKNIRKSNFGTFTVFVSAMNFSVNLAGPFFSVYMLRELGFNYMTYTIVIITATIVTLLSVNRWGAHADIAGNLRVIKLTSRFIPFVPILWLFSKSVYYLILIQVFAGFFWAGFNLCVSNFIFDAVSPEKRTRCISYFNTINGTAMCLGALIGGYLIWGLPRLSGSKILTIFLISGLMRFLVGILFLPKLKEVRRVEKFKSIDMFYSVLGIRPILEGQRR